MWLLGFQALNKAISPSTLNFWRQNSNLRHITSECDTRGEHQSKKLLKIFQINNPWQLLLLLAVSHEIAKVQNCNQVDRFFEKNAKIPPYSIGRGLLKMHWYKFLIAPRKHSENSTTSQKIATMVTWNKAISWRTIPSKTKKGFFMLTANIAKHW